MIKAPWTAKQVQNLEARQIRFGLHPYTCGNCSGDHRTIDLVPMGGGGGVLVALKSCRIGRIHRM